MHIVYGQTESGELESRAQVMNFCGTFGLIALERLTTTMNRHCKMQCFHCSLHFSYCTLHCSSLQSAMFILQFAMFILHFQQGTLHFAI